jgi:hypothetical protein
MAAMASADRTTAYMVCFMISSFGCEVAVSSNFPNRSDWETKAPFEQTPLDKDRIFHSIYHQCGGLYFWVFLNIMALIHSRCLCAAWHHPILYF